MWRREVLIFLRVPPGIKMVGSVGRADLRFFGEMSRSVEPSESENHFKCRIGRSSIPSRKFVAKTGSVDRVKKKIAPAARRRGMFQYSDFSRSELQAL